MGLKAPPPSDLADILLSTEWEDVVFLAISTSPETFFSNLQWLSTSGLSSSKEDELLFLRSNKVKHDRVFFLHIRRKEDCFLAQMLWFKVSY